MDMRVYYLNINDPVKNIHNENIMNIVLRYHNFHFYC